MNGITVTETRSLEVLAIEIRALTASMLTNIMEIGRRMCEAKELLPHGEFTDWIREETGYSTSTANNFMRIFKEYSAPQGSLFGPEANCQTFGNLSYSKALALLSVPAEEREEFAQRVNIDEISTRELQEAIKEREELRARAETAEDAAVAAQEQVRFAQEARDNIAEAYDTLKREYEELKNRPVEVAVAKADPAEIEAAVEKALKAAKKAHKKEMDEVLLKTAQAAKKNDELEKKVLSAEQKAAEAVKNNGFAEAEMYRREAEELRKKLAMSDPVIAEFKGLFAQAVDIVGKLRELLSRASDDGKQSLRKALDALKGQI